MRQGIGILLALANNKVFCGNWCSNIGRRPSLILAPMELGVVLGSCWHFGSGGFHLFLGFLS